MTRLGGAAWPDAGGGGLVIPVGATEQHGPHLPLDTDTAILAAVLERFEALRPEAWIAPALPFGASGEHAGFPGTLSLGRDALRACLLELGRSAEGFDRLLLASWHGGNAATLAAVAALHREEGRPAAAWTPRLVGGDAHAGRYETSIMLAIDPARVDTERAEAGASEPLPELMPRLRAEGVRAVSANGVLGDPAGASAEEGARLLDRAAAGLVAAWDELAASP